MNVKTAIVELIKAAKAGEPVLLMGPPGIAKSTIPQIVAELLSLPYREVRPAEFESVDFRGIPTVEAKRTTWNVPDFWPTEPCVLNFDEITQAPMELTSPLLKMFLGRSIGDYQLPAGTVLVATGNSASDRAGCSRLSSALRERCVVINIQPEFSEWVEWFQQQPFHDETIVEYLKLNPVQFHSWDAKLDFNQPTPRNWARVAKLLPFEPEQETIAGVIGQPVSEAFFRFRRANVKLPSVPAVIDGTEKLPTNPAIMSAFVKSVVEWASNFDPDSRGTSWENATGLIETLEGTYQVQFLKHVAKHDAKILKRPALRELVKRHAKAIVDCR